MNRLEKCEILKSKGHTYDPETGKIFGVRGKEIISRNTKGYVILTVKSKPNVQLYGHHFAWYMIYGNVDFIELDHKDTDPSNNRISNLRISDRTQQNQNTNAKGYSWIKRDSKWRSQITANKKKIFLGHFNTKEEARNSYLEAKKKYHKI